MSETTPITPPPSAEPSGMQKPVTRGALIWTVIILVVLSFLGSLLGAYLGNKNAEPVPTPTPTPTEVVSADEIYPPGAEMRAGKGAPGSSTGENGDLYIDVDTSDVWVYRNGEWQIAGNIRENAAENLTGEAGAPGEAGPTGAPGEPGTSVVLGAGAPDPLTCETEGDIYIDTTTNEYYSCIEEEWTLFAPPVEGTEAPAS